MSQDQDYYSNVRQAAQELWYAHHKLKGLQDQWNARDYTTTNPLPDGTGNNSDLTKADLSPVVFATTDAISTLMAAGHASNVARLL